jgi:hypothetical protein
LATRMRVAGENQDGSKWPIERHRTRQDASRAINHHHNNHYTLKITLANIRKYRLYTEPPSFEERHYLLKHAESVRIAIVTRHPTDSTPTRKTINDNNNGKQVKSMRVACEEHTHISSLVSGRDTVSKRLKIQFTGWRVACLSSARRR